MKFYHTLVQPYNDDSLNRQLDAYLTEQGIEYDMGADFADELSKFGFKVTLHVTGDKLLKKTIVLIDEHELSAIMLSVDKVSEIRNRPWIETKNKFRRLSKWLLKLK
jgi:hypothetical protein